MTNRKPLTYHVDIVMCIDKTGSVNRNYIQAVADRLV